MEEVEGEGVNWTLSIGTRPATIKARQIKMVITLKELNFCLCMIYSNYKLNEVVRIEQNAVIENNT